MISTLDPTRYEVAAKSPTGESFLLGYTPRVSRQGLLIVMQRHGEKIIAALHIGEKDQISFGTQPRPFATVAGWRLEFTGRTQRDAVHTEELPVLQP